MARPRKPRVADGVVLADNLYPDNKGRAGHYRYCRPNGSFKHFIADAVEDANRMAKEANALRHLDPACPTVSRESLVYQVPLYIRYREKQDPKLLRKASWRNRTGMLRAFADAFATLPVYSLTRQLLKPWWESLTFHKQKQRHAELRRLFNWLMGEGLCPKLEYNPFTTSDDMPRFYVTGELEKARVRLDRDAFWAVYAAAGDLEYPGLQIAMGISLIAFLRESDVLTLRLDQDLEGDLLKKVVSKSLHQKGSSRAARLQWDLGNHQLLKDLIQRGRELSMKNYRCPFLISHTPKVKKRGVTKVHVCQVTPRRLQEMFAEAVKLSGLYKHLPDTSNPPTFHEIRSLADKLATDAGYDIKTIQKVMAHESASTTMDYLDGHQLPFEAVDIVFTEAMIGGTF